MTGSYAGKVLRTVGRSDFFPEGPPPVFSPCLWEPQVSLPFRPPLVLPYTPFPSLWREGVWIPGSPPHLPLLFTVPSHDLWSYKTQAAAEARDAFA